MNEVRISMTTVRFFKRIMRPVAEEGIISLPEYNEAISQLTTGVDQISAVVQTNSATSEESAAASQELSSQAVMMKQMVQRFHLRNMGGSIVKETAPEQDYSASMPVMPDSELEDNRFSKY